MVDPSAAAPPTVVQVVQPSPSLLGRFIRFVFSLLGIAIVSFGLLFLGIVAIVAVASLASTTDLLVEEKYHSLNEQGTDKIAIITVEGTILEGDGFVKRQIDHVRKDKSVKAVVLRVDSPGGTVTGSDFIHHHLLQLREERKLPIVVSMGGLAASGGYYVSMAVGDTPESIYAEPTTWTGSIGVIIPHYDLSGLMKNINVADDSIKSGPLKQMGAFTRPMTEAEKKALQGLVDDSFKRFKQIILDGRPKFKADPELLDKVATGEVFAADQAVANGLVDKVGFIEAAIDRVVVLAKLDRAHTKVVKYKRPFALMDGLIASQAKAPQSSELQMLLDLAAPRAYYLSTWLPLLSRSEH